MMNDVCECYVWQIGEVKYFELRETYGKLCENGVLNDEYKIIEVKRLTHALSFLQSFKIEWMKIVLIRIHDSLLWLENG